MADFIGLSRNCGITVIKGVKSKFYLQHKDEFDGWPQTREEIVLAASGTPVAGDSKILDEPFTFVATPDLGFWRGVDILVDTGQFTNTGEGELGGQDGKNRFEFFVLGNGPAEREFIDRLYAYSGCIIGLIPPKQGMPHVLGDLENPVFIESHEGGTGGDRVGYLVTLYSSAGFTNMSYDSDTHGIDITPNP